jgi:GxxExxY protein
MADLIFKDESFAIMGACFEVYSAEGCGFVEPIYQECLEIELLHRGIPFVAQPELEILYRGQKLSRKYQPDFVCYGKIILEIKAAQNLAREHQAQVMNYLKATGFELGLLVNFGHYPRVESERIVNSTSQRLA